MSVQMGDTQIGRSCVPIGIGGGIGAPFLGLEGMHPSDPVSSSSPSPGLDLGECGGPPS